MIAVNQTIQIQLEHSVAAFLESEPPQMAA
jgi:hypothetical protein